MKGLLMVAASQLPFIRLWWGSTQLPGGGHNLTPDEFARGLKYALIPDTTKVNAGQGLVGYTPSVIDGDKECALVVYDRRENYEAIRETPAGKHYGAEHFKIEGVTDNPDLAALEGKSFFVDEKVKTESGQSWAVSRSLVAALFEGTAQMDAAYVTTLKENMNWQAGAVLTRVREVDASVETNVFLESARTYLAANQDRLGLNAHVVGLRECLGRRYVIEYIYADSREQIDHFLADASQEDLERITKPVRALYAQELSHAAAQRHEFEIDTANGSAFVLAGF